MLLFIVSPQTNKTLLEMGVKHCSNETCLPVKVFHGHVLALKETTDFIFIPRYISLSKNAYCCPKLCGLPDMTLLNLKNTLNVIELNIDFNNGKLKTLQSLQKIASYLELDYENVENTYNSIMGIYLEDQIHQDMQNTGILNSNKCAAFAVLGILMFFMIII
jgi:predicted nucleotide-binding protein (sugar kinase/HSP70/actin superfamily)